MVQVLTWDPGMEPWCAALHSSFVNEIVENVEQLARKFNPNNEEDCYLQTLLDLGLQRVLTAPETSYRLLWQPHSEDSFEFLRECLSTELIIESGVSDVSMRWSALGDVYLGDQVYEHLVPGLSPIDFGSPYALFANYQEGPARLADVHRHLKKKARRSVLEKLGGASTILANSAPFVPQFCRTFLKVIVCIPDKHDPDLYCSGTSAQFVGRAIFTNPHLSSVSAEAIAEAIVHEATHGMLYMQERTMPWVPPEYYGPEDKTYVSPWTGTPLPLRPYLQAYFVWFGILNFWLRVHESPEWQRGRVRNRIRTALGGFLRSNIAQDKRLSIVDEGLVEELIVMTENVRRLAE